MPLAVTLVVVDSTADALSCEEIAARTGKPLRTVQRQVAKWAKQGWPRVTRAATDSRKWRLLVVREDYEALGRLDFPEHLFAEAA